MFGGEIPNTVSCCKWLITKSSQLLIESWNHRVDNLWVYKAWESNLGGLKIWCGKTHLLKKVPDLDESQNRWLVG